MTKFIQSIYFHILITVKPILLWLGKIYPNFSSKEHIFKRYYEIENSLNPGDIILTKSDAHLSNLTNIGYWKHAVVYVGKEKGIPMVVEAIGEGVVKRTLVEMLSSKDRIAILRPTTKLIQNQKQMDAFVSWVKEQVGKPYDYMFDTFSANAHANFYCSEIPYVGIRKVNVEADFGLRATHGILTVTPMDLFNMIAKLKFALILLIERKSENSH